MSRNSICRRPGQYPIEAPGGEDAFPCALAGGAQENGNAPPLPTGGEDAKRPDGASNRPLRSLPSLGEASLASLSDFVMYESVLPENEFRILVSLSVSDIQLRLARMVRLRAGRDFAALALEARAIAKASGILGALRAGAAALRLEAACDRGDHAATCRLISELAQACSEAELALPCQSGAEIS